jgi:hypothetical protein
MYKNGVQLIYFMRGAITLEEMLNLTAFEREVITEFVEERIAEELKKKHTPPIY